MTGFIIDFFIVLIVGLCAYRGFRAGVVRGVAGFLALILSLVIASSVSSAFADEFTGVVSPFVGGLVDSQIQKILAPEDAAATAAAGGTSSKITIAPEEAADYDADTTDGMTMIILRQLGFFKPIAEKITDTVKEETRELGFALGDVITAKLSSILVRIALFAVAFILLAIAFAIIGNLIDVVFSLPGLKTIDQISGTVMGLLRGLLIIFFVATLLRYFGIIATGTIEKTAILEYMIVHNPVANALKI